jgi:hypothetical protein
MKAAGPELLDESFQFAVGHAIGFRLVALEIAWRLQRERGLHEWRVSDRFPGDPLAHER